MRMNNEQMSVKKKKNASSLLQKYNELLFKHLKRRCQFAFYFNYDFKYKCDIQKLSVSQI